MAQSQFAPGKLSDEERQEIVSLQGKESTYKLAKRFGVSHTAIYKVWNAAKAKSKSKKQIKQPKARTQTGNFRKNSNDDIEDGIDFEDSIAQQAVNRNAEKLNQIYQANIEELKKEISNLETALEQKIIENNKLREVPPSSDYIHKYNRHEFLAMLRTSNKKDGPTIRLQTRCFNGKGKRANANNHHSQNIVLETIEWLQTL